MILEGDSEHTPPVPISRRPFCSCCHGRGAAPVETAAALPHRGLRGQGEGLAEVSHPADRDRLAPRSFTPSVSENGFPGAVAECEEVRFGAGGNRTPTGSCSHSQASPPLCGAAARPYWWVRPHPRAGRAIRPRPVHSWSFLQECHFSRFAPEMQLAAAAVPVLRGIVADWQRGTLPPVCVLKVSGICPAPALLEEGTHRTAALRRSCGGAYPPGSCCQGNRGVFGPVRVRVRVLVTTPPRAGVSTVNRAASTCRGSPW